ncbi:MAG: SpoVA/SpoVAEb family sporulation membrane protein [Oscillospiraceae bacterium]|nr:SpoVA/SpoVAEb family sporulation membrane protein [Oscillospiraceae bacterium]
MKTEENIRGKTMISKLHTTTKEDYTRMVKEREGKSPMAKNLLLSFLIGGGICTLGQLLIVLYETLGFEKQMASTLCSVSLVFLSCLFTGLGLFPLLAKHAGAGTLVPITGFANSMTAPAMEYRCEGLITGIGVKMFTIAGPVIVYGTVASVVYGVIYWVTTVL